MSTDLTGVATYEDRQWRAAAITWAVGRLGLSLAGEPEHPHVRPWSTVIRLPVDGGQVWLKSVGAGSAQEPALVGALAEWVPARVLTPLAVDESRRLMLLPDGGPTLRSTGASRSVTTWETLLAEYAQLQIAVARHVPDMLDLGVPDASPARLPGLVAGLLADDGAMLLDRPDGLTTPVRDRIAAAGEEYAELCRRLAEGAVPLSVQHDDLHDNNVFAGPDGHRFFDWGDATVSHPFLSLLVALRSAASALAVAPGDRLLRRLRDAYLEPWSAFGSPVELRELCRIALRVGPPARALTWRRILLGIRPAERVEWNPFVAGWMAEYLEAGSLEPATA